jgi:hypothetical protein
MPKSWVGLVGVIGVAGGYLLLREAYDPGYLAALNEVEWGNLFSDTYSGHAQPFYFYIQNLLLDRFFHWIFILDPVALIGMLNAPKIHRDVLIFCGIMTLQVLLVFSIAQTKLYWYDGPIYPFLAIMVAVGTMVTIEYLMKSSLVKRCALAAFAVTLFFSGYRVLQHINHPDSYPVDYEGQLMSEFKEAHPTQKNFTVYKQVTDARLQRVMVFYKQAWEAEG